MSYVLIRITSAKSLQRITDEIFKLLREQMAPTSTTAMKSLKYCDLAVKIILTSHTRCNKTKDPSEFSGNELNDYLGLYGRGLEEQKNYRVCANIADRVTTYWFDRISLEISYISCFILYLHVRYLDVY